MKIDGDWLTSPDTQALFDLFSKAGFRLFCVGGCVRNAVLDVPVADIDMATDATPDQVAECAEHAGLRSIPTGLDHGTVTVISGQTTYEITTFRKDIATDGRHADVAFSSDLSDDAARRDFTMNALYCDLHGEVTDLVGGLEDLAHKRIRFINDAAARIAEDYLRILRFFRFHAWYGNPSGGLDQDALSAIAEAADKLRNLSKERVGAEMIKLLGARDPAPAIAAMTHCGVLNVVMPGADPKALALLVHLEHHRAPDWIRRALVLGGEALDDAWRLTRAQARELAMAREDIHQMRGLDEMAYDNGADYAENIALARAALFETPLQDNWEDTIKTASTASCPVKAVDLMPEFEGPELGARLKQLEKRWIASGFKLSKEELLSN